jgi:hypothetical protein
VPTYWETNTKKKTVTKRTILTNNLGDLYLMLEEELDMETQESRNTKYHGPYRLFSDNDLENLFHLKKQVA